MIYVVCPGVILALIVVFVVIIRTLQAVGNNAAIVTVLSCSSYTRYFINRM